MDLEQLEKAAAGCVSCELCEGRLNPVFAKGNFKSTVMICGMVPADEENKAGLPFVGRAGHLLDEILIDAGWALNDVYITNLVKCYLAAGLPLKSNWIDSCLPYLITQIGLIKPKVIITLGKDASSTLLAIDSKIALGTIRKQRVYEYAPGIKVIPTYHPSYLLRGGGKGHKSYSSVIDDFLLAKELSLDNQ
jgi:uracil-DNA glycosylase family 4